MIEWKSRRLFLASKSPRRHELMSLAGIPFEVVISDTEETFDPTMDPHLVPEYLAAIKANACSYVLTKANDLLISADSIVLLDERILGKPIDKKQAAEFLALLSDRNHQVITGVCIKSMTKEIYFSEIAEVWFNPMSAEEINYYIDHYETMDKAGAYAVQEWIGVCKIREIKGTYTNIMGLPMARLYQELMHF